MSQTIWKFPLEVTDLQAVSMPQKSTVLSVAAQNERIVLYALVDPSSPVSERWFRIVGTGHPAPEQLHPTQFIGTVSLYDGVLMFHVFRWMV